MRHNANLPTRRGGAQRVVNGAVHSVTDDCGRLLLLALCFFSPQGQGADAGATGSTRQEAAWHAHGPVPRTVSL